MNSTKLLEPMSTLTRYGSLRMTSALCRSRAWSAACFDTLIVSGANVFSAMVTERSLVMSSSCSSLTPRQLLAFTRRCFSEERRARSSEASGSLKQPVATSSERTSALTRCRSSAVQTEANETSVRWRIDDVAGDGLHERLGDVGESQLGELLETVGAQLELHVLVHVVEFPARVELEATCADDEGFELGQICE